MRPTRVSGAKQTIPRPLTKPRCHNCRRKKIKCDYIRPSCGPCSRSKYPCEGYDRALVFVSQREEAPGARVHEHKKGSKALVATGDLVLLGTPSEPEHNRQAFFSQFLTYFLPVKDINNHTIEMQWIRNLPVMRQRFKPLDTVINAVGVMLCARAKHDEGLHTHGMMLYGDALRGMGKCHVDGKLRTLRLHEAVLTSLLLQFYETVDGVESAAQATHLLGISILMKLVGPESFQDPTFRSTFAFCRIHLIIGSIVAEHPAVQPSSWCFGPWGRLLQDPIQVSMDSLVYIPGYMAVADRLCSGQGSDADHETFHALRSQIEHGLEKYYADEIASKEEPLFRVEKVSDDEVDPVLKSFGYELKYKSLADCSIICYYWAAKILLFRGWERISQYENGQQQPNGTDDESPGAIDVELEAALGIATAMADNICISIRELFRQESGIAGVHAATLPLRVAYKFYSSHGMADRQEWCRRMIQGLMPRNFGAPHWIMF